MYKGLDYKPNSYKEEKFSFITTPILFKDDIETDYYKSYFSLINNKELINYIEENKIKVYFYLHRNMQKYEDYFTSTSKNIIVVKNNQIDIQKLLKDMEARNQMAQDTKFYQYKEVINDKEYVFQYCGKRRSLQVIDESSDEKGNILKEKLLDNVLKTIVVNPSVNLDSFDDEEYMDDYDRVTEVANIIFGGKFRNNENLKY